MKKLTMHTKRITAAIFSLVLPLFISILACNMVGAPSAVQQSADLTATSLEETRSALDALLTQDAQAAANQAQQTLQAGIQPSPSPNPIIQQMQSTLDAQATLIAQKAQSPVPSLPTAAQPSPTSTFQPTFTTLTLTEWNSKTFRPDNGCSEPSQNIRCWSGSGVELIMETAQRITIDANWKRPYLAFEHRYDFNVPATIYVKANGPLEILWTFAEGSSSAWQPAKADLSKYKGKEIFIQFAISGSSSKYWWKNPPKNQWMIRNVRIEPEYRP